MTMHDRTFDVIGVGFGPSNLALAIALDEAARRERPGLAFHFVEKQPHFTWHGGMLLPDSDMQISFLKDLVSLRDPTSPFTFVNYLHEKGRLTAFINRKTFFPSRIEFNDYLRWAASCFAERCSYGEEVVALEPAAERDGTVTAFTVRSRAADGTERLRRARNVVIAAGGAPQLPECFAPLAGDTRIMHSSRYLDRIAGLGLTDAPATRIAVVGGGQSAAEIFCDLAGRFGRAAIDLLVRGRALKPADDSPFVNEIFDPEGTGAFFGQPPAARHAFLDEFRNTNYAVVDHDLIQRIYDMLYEQRVAGGNRLALRSGRAVVAAAADRDGIMLTLAGSEGGAAEERRYDAVVLATGYKRGLDRRLLAPLAPYLAGATADRDYRLPMVEGSEAGLFVQGQSETTHGLSDTLLSVVAVRSREIATAIVERLPPPPVPAEQFMRPVRLAASS